jgi:hypothetical protein
VRWSEDAKPIWAEAYRQLCEARPGAWGRACGRARVQALRLSLIYALIDGSAEIRPEHVRAGLALWGYCERCCRRAFEEEEANKKQTTNTAREDTAILALRLLSLIRERPEEGLSRSELLRAIRTVDVDTLDQALSCLEAEGKAHPRAVRPKGSGRIAERWFPGPAPKDGPGPGPDDGLGKERKERKNSPAPEGAGGGTGRILSFLPSFPEDGPEGEGEFFLSFPEDKPEGEGGPGAKAVDGVVGCFCPLEAPAKEEHGLLNGLHISPSGEGEPGPGEGGRKERKNSPAEAELSIPQPEPSAEPARGWL